MPVSDGSSLKSSMKASKPPAEAPMPTIGKPGEAGGWALNLALDEACGACRLRVASSGFCRDLGRDVGVLVFANWPPVFLFSMRKNLPAYVRLGGGDARELPTQEGVAILPEVSV